MELTEIINEMIGTLKSIEVKLKDLSNELRKSLSSMSQTSPIAVNTVKKKTDFENFDFTMKKNQPRPLLAFPEKNTTKKRGRKPKSKANKFVDDGLDVSKEEVGYDQIQDNNQSVKRNRREPFKLASCVCEDCKKTFEVNPVFKRDYYVCDSCISKKAGKT